MSVCRLISFSLSFVLTTLHGGTPLVNQVQPYAVTKQFAPSNSVIKHYDGNNLFQKVTSDSNGKSQICGGMTLGKKDREACFGVVNRVSLTSFHWTPISTVGAPSARALHAAVWTGSEMIVWGGSDSLAEGVNTGGKYNLANNTWSTTATVGAPPGSISAAAAWTGQEMVVWGGRGPWYYPGNCICGRDSSGSGVTCANAYDTPKNTGGVYDPASNSWVSITTLGAPSPRFAHTMVANNSKIIVWGGYSGAQGTCPNTIFTPFSNGGVYDLATKIWKPTSLTKAPSARWAHTAILTPNGKMIVWGGQYGGSCNGGPAGFSWSCWPDPIVYLNTGAIYDLATDTWTPMSVINAPAARSYHQAVWTGTRMIVWGGTAGNTGGIFDPETNTWVSATSLVNAPPSSGTAVYASSQMMAWQTKQTKPTRSMYDPAANTWSLMNTANEPAARSGFTAISTGIKMIVWGGGGSSGYLSDGGSYGP